MGIWKEGSQLNAQVISAMRGLRADPVNREGLQLRYDVIDDVFVGLFHEKPSSSADVDNAGLIAEHHASRCALLLLAFGRIEVDMIDIPPIHQTPSRPTGGGPTRSAVALKIKRRKRSGLNGDWSGGG